MAALTIDVPDSIAEALRGAGIIPEGALEADEVALEGAVRWNIEQATGEIIDAAQRGCPFDSEAVAALAGRIEALAQAPREATRPRVVASLSPKGDIAPPVHETHRVHGEIEGGAA